jgi:hypothetical protein
MFRALTILAALVTLAVTAAPVASAGTSKNPPPREFEIKDSSFATSFMFHGSGGDGQRRSQMLG